MIPIFISSDDNYAPYLAASIVSILENTDSFINFYILDSGISDSNINKLCLIKNKYKNFSIEFIKIDSEKEFSTIETNNNQAKHVTIATYNRFLIPSLKPDISKAIYLDVDIIANGDIASLYNHDLKSYAIGAIPGQMIEVSNLCISRLGLSPEHKIFNAGVLLMDIQKFNKQNIIQSFFEIEKQYRDKMLYGDQDILNIYFNNNYLQIDKIFNYEAITGALCDNFILRHYTSDLKPWHINPNLNTTILNDKNIFWYYLAKTDFYYDVLKNCKFNTKKSLYEKELNFLLNKKHKCIKNKINFIKKVLNTKSYKQMDNKQKSYYLNLMTTCILKNKNNKLCDKFQIIIFAEYLRKNISHNILKSCEGYKKISFTKNLLKTILSVENTYKGNSKYKAFTVFGIKLKLRIKNYDSISSNTRL